ncbi:MULTISPECIES: DUF6541 family protein [Bacteria]|uniref:DUF6541 family protein n=1 Tax=Bacteria TaxID=2 RepID=UPI003C7E2967
MTWLALALSTGALALIVLVPGGMIAALLGFRGLWLPAIAVPAGVSVIAIAATAGPLLGIRWGILPVLISTVGIAVVAGVLRLLLWRGTALLEAPRLSRGAMLAVAAATLAVAAQVVLVIRAPEAISQTFDNIFHLNAIRYALDTGSASPLTLGQMTSGESGGIPFYPSAWHAMGSLLVQLTGVSIPVASNAMTIFFAAAWPVSAILFARVLFSGGTALVVGAAAVSAALPAFPLLMIRYGVLFPYMVSIALIGTALALLWGALNARGRARWPFTVALAGVLPALVISHPGGFVAFLFFATMVLVPFFIGFLRDARSAGARAGAVAGAVAYLLIGGVAWYVLRPPAAARTWLPEETIGQAVGEVLTVSVYRMPVNLVIAALVVVGIVVALRRRSRADVVALLVFLAAAGLYIVVSGLPYPLLRDILTGTWYNNVPRLAALLPVAWVPLGALGAAELWRLVTDRIARTGGARWKSVLATALSVVLLVFVPQAVTMRQAIGTAHATFRMDADSQLLSSDEQILLSRLDKEVPEGALIVGSPWTGTALAYALANRPVMLPHTLTDITEGKKAIVDGLDHADPQSPACAAVRDLKASYALDFGTRQVNDSHVTYSGLDDLSGSPNLTLVDQQGEAKLYKITGCGVDG